MDSLTNAKDQATEAAILCVDDEAHVFNAIKRALRKEGYRIFTATRGEDGLSIIEKEPIHVVISDLNMPGMDGAEFLHQVKQKSPDTARIALTGTQDLELISQSVNMGQADCILTKPWEVRVLRIRVAQAFSHYRLSRGVREMTARMQKEKNDLQFRHKMTLMELDHCIDRIDLMNEVLDKLPMPVIAVDQNEEITFLNSAFKETFSSFDQDLVGENMREIFPADLADVAESGLHGVQLPDMPFVLDGKNVLVDMNSLKRCNTYQGCVLMFQQDFSA